MTDIDTSRLRALAEAAGSEQWHLSKYGSVMDVTNNFEIVPAEMASDDKAFIAAANPAAIIALLDRLEALEQKCILYSASLNQADVRLEAAEVDVKRLDWFAKHSMREASMRFDDGSFKAVNAWTIASSGTDLRTAIDAALSQDEKGD